MKRMTASTRCVLAANFSFLLLCSCSLSARICVAERVTVHRVCGQVIDANGQIVGEQEVTLAKSDRTTVVATTKTDSDGHFSIEDLDKGDYFLVIKSDPWLGMEWPIRVTKRSASKVCTHPMYVIVSPVTPAGCPETVTTKKPKFNAQTH